MRRPEPDLSPPDGPEPAITWQRDPSNPKKQLALNRNGHEVGFIIGTSRPVHAFSTRKEKACRTITVAKAWVEDQYQEASGG